MSLELEREQTVQILCQQFAHDQLSTQDLENRLEAVYRASNPEELHALVAELPALPSRDPETGQHRSFRLTARGSSTADARIAPVRTTAPQEQRVLAAFGSVRKRGEWEPAERTRGVAMFGELELDFREALIPIGVTTVQVLAVFGSVRVIVPPGVHVECDGSAIVGTFSETSSPSVGASTDAPTLRITGMAVCGDVKVVMRLPDESEMQALKRERER